MPRGAETRGMVSHRSARHPLFTSTLVHRRGHRHLRALVFAFQARATATSPNWLGSWEYALPRARSCVGSCATPSEFEKCWQAHERPVGDSWRCDETYLNVRGRWVYLYRAVDKQGKTVQSYLEPYSRHHRRQGVFPEGASPSRRPTGDYSGRFRAHACRFASDGHEQRI